MEGCGCVWEEKRGGGCVRMGIWVWYVCRGLGCGGRRGSMGLRVKCGCVGGWCVRVGVGVWCACESKDGGGDKWSGGGGERRIELGCFGKLQAFVNCRSTRQKGGKMVALHGINIASECAIT